MMAKIDYKIVIPSYQRADARQFTLDYIPPSLYEKTHLIVRPEEKKDYQRTIQLPINITTCAKRGIAEVRQWAITTFAKRIKVDCILMLDDDLKFYIRPDVEKPPLIYATKKQVGVLLNRMAREAMKKNYFACGLSLRQGNNHQLTSTCENMRMCNAYALNTTVINKEKIRFNEMVVMEDFYVTLGMLTRGYKNKMIFDHCQGQAISNAEGGCSTYRTAAVQKEAAHKLKDHFPDFVTVVTKKSLWKDMEGRTDVRVQWKKAYNLGLSKRKMGA